jgi:hypothetical protein
MKPGNFPGILPTEARPGPPMSWPIGKPSAPASTDDAPDRPGALRRLQARQATERDPVRSARPCRQEAPRGPARPGTVPSHTPSPRNRGAIPRLHPAVAVRLPAPVELPRTPHRERTTPAVGGNQAVWAVMMRARRSAISAGCDSIGPHGTSNGRVSGRTPLWGGDALLGDAFPQGNRLSERGYPFVV